VTAATAAGTSRATPRRHGSRAERALPALTLAGVAVTVVAGLGIEAAGRQIGTATPPFVMAFGLSAHPLVLPAAAVAVAVVAATGRLLRARRPAPALAAAALALALSINAARHGPGALTAIFDTGPGGSFEAPNEYLPALPALSYGPGFFLDRFAELVPSLPVNVAGHPPALLLTLDAIGATTPARMAAVCIAAAALTAPLTYALARGVLDERRARLAGLLAACSPDLLLFGTTSADAVYAALGAATGALLVRRGRVARGAGAALLAVSALFSWALLAIGAWAAVLAWRRDGVRAAARLAGLCAAAVVVAQGLLAAGTGYDPVGALRATEAVYRHSLASVRPYAYWVAGSPAAWIAMLGLPIAWAALVALARRRPAAIAVAAVVAVAALGGFTKAETERIWLPFVPLACVAAAEALPLNRARIAVAALLAQALAVELLFSTIW
jgi:methylthioxylose transferase